MKDYCTWFPDGSWGVCCKRHDRRYENNRLTKGQADKLLFRCVKKKSWFMAYTMYIGVSLFGGYWYNKAQDNKGI